MTGLVVVPSVRCVVVDMVAIEEKDIVVRMMFDERELRQQPFRAVLFGALSVSDSF